MNLIILKKIVAPNPYVKKCVPRGKERKPIIKKNKLKKSVFWKSIKLSINFVIIIIIIDGKNKPIIPNDARPSMIYELMLRCHHRKDL